MCLEIVAVVASGAKQPVSARTLANATGLVVKSVEFGGKRGLHLSRTGGCSCDFLGDDAEFEGEHWVLNSQGLPALAKSIEYLSSTVRRFSVVAHWLGGDRERRNLRIGAADLARLVRANQLGNNVVYHVGHDG